jgi:mannose-6-phosphate isomerase-like protein (cupin superfamily)
MKQILLTAIITILCAGFSYAQERKPSEPIRPYVFKTKQDVSSIEKALHSINSEIKTKDLVTKTEDLIGGEGLQIRVAIQYDAKKNVALAEVHDASDDVFYVLEGSAELTLGGKLENPKETTSGEWRADKIIGGTTYTIKKGDLIVVPRGTPHQRINSRSKTFSLLLIKIFKDSILSKK